MTAKVKHRDERRLVNLDFTPELNGSTISSVGLLEIRDANGTDKTSEFRSGESAAAHNGAKVSFWVKKASSGEQLAGTYKIKCRVVLVNTEEPIALKDTKLVALVVVGD